MGSFRATFFFCVCSCVPVYVHVFIDVFESCLCFSSGFCFCFGFRVCPCFCCCFWFLLRFDVHWWRASFAPSLYISVFVFFVLAFLFCFLSASLCFFGFRVALFLFVVVSSFFNLVGVARFFLVACLLSFLLSLLIAFLISFSSGTKTFSTFHARSAVRVCDHVALVPGVRSAFVIMVLWHHGLACLLACSFSSSRLRHQTGHKRKTDNMFATSKWAQQSYREKSYTKERRALLSFTAKFTDRQGRFQENQYRVTNQFLSFCQVLLPTFQLLPEHFASNSQSVLVDSVPIRKHTLSFDPPPCFPCVNIGTSSTSRQQQLRHKLAIHHRTQCVMKARVFATQDAPHGPATTSSGSALLPPQMLHPPDDTQPVQVTH